MDFQQYQQQAARTVNPAQTNYANMLNFALGLCGEAGEVAEHIKKFFYHDRALDEQAVTKELGDVLWYVAGLCTALGLDMGEVAQGNIAKLRERWPHGFMAQTRTGGVASE